MIFFTYLKHLKNFKCYGPCNYFKLTYKGTTSSKGNYWFNNCCHGDLTTTASSKGNNYWLNNRCHGDLYPPKRCAGI